MRLTTRTGSGASDKYEFELYLVQSVQQNISQEGITINYPGSKYTESQTFPFEGDEGDFMLDFELQERDSDISNNTAPDPPFTSNEVTTRTEQIRYLRDYMKQQDSRTIYYLKYDFYFGSGNEKEVRLKKINISGASEEKKIDVTLEFDFVTNIDRSWEAP